MSKLQLAFLHERAPVRAVTISMEATVKQANVLRVRSMRSIPLLLIVSCVSLDTTNLKRTMLPFAECVLNIIMHQSLGQKSVKNVSGLFLSIPWTRNARNAVWISLQVCQCCIGIICWSLTFYFAPMVFGLPIVVADISLGPYLPSEKRKEEGGPFVKQKNHGIC